MYSLKALEHNGKNDAGFTASVGGLHVRSRHPRAFCELRAGRAIISLGELQVRSVLRRVRSGRRACSRAPGPGLRGLLPALGTWANFLVRRTRPSPAARRLVRWSRT